ncbi:MAG: hypothetical protein A2Y38_23130 [Spirochaetes bacterium GWB1_59_5]|nr:MAG: hypothetical protein A2Y38_23130 [Spirochaetes bacterium GWB1_59_5]
MVHRVVTLADPRSDDFLAYCAAHGAEHDESYIPGAAWEFGDDYPSFLLQGEDGSVRGAAAVMLGPSLRAARKARIAILHVSGEATELEYRNLLASVVASIKDSAEELYLFIPEALVELRAILGRAGFSFERTAFLMRTETSTPEHPTRAAVFPEGYSSSPVMAGDISAIAEFIATRNRNFREVKGSSDARTEDLVSFIASGEYLEGGLVRLVAPDGGTCGTLRVERDEEDGSAFIGTISVDKNHRGKGLARGLIRTALSIAGNAGIQAAFLSVNADNSAALDLYRKEGFSVVKAMTCLSASTAALQAQGV